MQEICTNITILMIESSNCIYLVKPQLCIGQTIKLICKFANQESKGLVNMLQEINSKKYTGVVFISPRNTLQIFKFFKKKWVRHSAVWTFFIQIKKLRQILLRHIFMIQFLFDSAKNPFDYNYPIKILLRGIYFFFFFSIVQKL